MMTTYFLSILVLQMARGRMLGRPLDPVQLQYLAILKLSPEVFLYPEGGV